MDSNGRTIWILDAHGDNGKLLVVRADEKLTAFVELESTISACGELPRQAGEIFPKLPGYEKVFFDRSGPRVFAEAASAEPLTELQPAAKSKERYEQADRRINELYQQLLPKIDKDQQAAFRDDQRNWIKTRDLGAKLYKESGIASAPERRYWQYMLDSTQAQLRHIETD